MKKHLITAISLILLGCGEMPYEQPVSYQPGTNAAYTIGQNDGCSSGSSASGDITRQFTKNVDRYINDAYYKNGWDDGYARCKAQGDQINAVIRQSL